MESDLKKDKYATPAKIGGEGGDSDPASTIQDPGLTPATIKIPNALPIGDAGRSRRPYIERKIVSELARATQETPTRRGSSRRQPSPET